MIIFLYNTRLWNKVPIAKILQQHKHLLPLTTSNPIQGHQHSKSLGQLFFNHTTVTNDTKHNARHFLKLPASA